MLTLTQRSLDQADTGEKALTGATAKLGVIPVKCPRCGADVEQRFYGPCEDCRGALVAKYAPPAEPSPPPAVTVRMPRRSRARSATYLDWTTGVGVTTDGEPVDVGARAPVARLLGVPTDRVYLTGPRPHAGDDGAWHRWAHDVVLPAGWEVGEHYTDRPSAPVLRWERPEDRRRLECLRAAGWWGEGASATDCVGAHQRLGVLLAETWPGDNASDPAVLLSSPTTTGRELILRSIPHGAEWPTLPDELAELVRSTMGQGRIEPPRPAGHTVPGIVEYDGRWMYGALCRELPGGVPSWGRGDHGQGDYARCRVLASWTVPAGWEHLGILGYRPEADGPWHYPARPGESGRGWVDGVELHLARRWGWTVDVAEHIVWPNYRGAGPLDGWARRLLALGERSQDDPLVYAAIRRLMINTIGGLVSRRHHHTRTVPLTDDPELPADAVSPRVEGDALVWSEPGRPPWAVMAHPEWAAAIYARCRARMLSGPPVHGVRTGALHAPPGDLLAIETDALYLTRDPDWPDDGAPGRLRRKLVVAGPLPSPTSLAGIRLLKGAR